MPTAPVDGLLGAVRRRLWRGQFVAALRRALWGSAGLMLLATAVHLAARRVPAGAVLTAIAALWLSMLAWAGTRRPAVAACALWADRHLGGASAFSTLLETRAGAKTTRNPQAVRWLESWAAAQVPDALRRLAEQREAAHLFRPLLAMLVCAALTALVLSMPASAPDARQPSAVSASAGGDQAAAQGEPAAAHTVDKLAAALRSASLQQPPESTPVRRETGQAQASAPDKADGAAPTVQASGRPAGEPATRKSAPTGAATDAAAAAGATATAATPRADGTGEGSGNAAGDSRDARGDTGVSPAPRVTITGPESRLASRPVSTEMQADMGRQGSYDPEPSMAGAKALPALVAAPAVAPPAASESTRLSPAETSYVQAWMKANPQRR